MRRDFPYVSRYVIIKNRWEKNVLRKFYMGVPMFFVLLILSCAHYDYIGTWNQEPGTLTYINHDQHIKVTFPSDIWQVYTKPSSGSMRKLWIKPTNAEPEYTVIVATIQSMLICMEIAVSPVRSDVSLEDFLALETQEDMPGVKFLSSEVVERGNRTIGLLEWKVKYLRMYAAYFKEKGRFTMLGLGGPDSSFMVLELQFRALVDSYEYIE